MELRTTFALLLLAACQSVLASSLTGVLKTASGERVTDARATLTKKSGARRASPRTVTAGPEGTFRFADVAAGQYTLTIAAAGFQTLHCDVTISPQEDASLPDLVLAPPPPLRPVMGKPWAKLSKSGKPDVAIDGRVIPNSGGAPTIVVTADFGDRTSVNVPLDGSGHFAVRLPEAGAYSLEISKAGFHRAVATGVSLEIGDRLSINPVHLDRCEKGDPCTNATYLNGIVIIQ